MAARWIIAALFVLILGMPMVMSRCARADHEEDRSDLPTLIVVSPHVPQIREEFGRAFDEWHRREHGTGVRVDYRTIGGTSEIIRALEARYRSALAEGRYEIAGDGDVLIPEGTIEFDILFGGGSYDHGRVKAGVVFERPDGDQITVPMSVPAGFEQDRLDAWFGENTVGAGKLYDEEQYWIGTALSGFGVVYNRDLIRELLGRTDLTSFEDLTDPRLAGWVALADPRQSGSITTSMDAILSGYGWERGWKALRGMAANTRYFTNSSSKPPIDVSQGEAAAGLAIDFYGRSQSQIVMLPGETPETARVGYVDPPGEVSIDADPISILRGGPNPVMARRFVEFVMTDEGQALWNLEAVEGGGDAGPAAGIPRAAGGSGVPLGPRRFELRRMPIKRDFYERYGDALIDKVNPYEVASDTPPAGWRSAIGMMMGAFGVDNHESIREAWLALRRARERGVDTGTIAEAEEAFYAFPSPEQVERIWADLFGTGEPSVPEGALLPFTPENYRSIRGTWRDPAVESRLSIVYTQAFAENYAHVTNMLAEATRHATDR